jgi:hypothetical protein
MRTPRPLQPPLLLPRKLILLGRLLRSDLRLLSFLFCGRGVRLLGRSLLPRLL